MLSRITQFPFFKIAIFCALGILIERHFEGSWVWLFLIAATIGTSVLLAAWRGGPLWLHRHWPSYFFPVLLAAMSATSYYWRSGLHFQQHLSKHLASEGTVAFMLCDDPVLKKTTLSVKAKALALKTRNGLQHVTGKAVLYFPRADTASQDLGYGDVVYVALSALSQPRGPVNPGQFNYKAYLARDKIYLTAYLKNAWKPSGINQGRAFLTKIYALRGQLHKKLVRLEPELESIASAMLLGDKEGMDSRVKQSFSKSGTMHVLAVSGLHVGIIYIILTRLLHVLLFLRYGRQLQVAIIIGVLFSYAAITGFSPSVLRASFMFSVVAFANGFGRKNSVYNNVMFSAVVLLLINPQLLLHVGFQMSYLAVLGILVFQPPLSALFNTNSWLLGYLRDICTVSLAAQAATLPLGIYYFHQAPVYFLAANLLIIPAAALLLSLGFLYFLLTYIWPWMAELVFTIFEGLLWLTYSGIEQIAGWPFSTIGALNISLLECLLLLVGLWALLAFSLYGHGKKTLGISLISGLLLSASLVSKEWQSQKQEGITLLGLKGHSAVVIYKGKSALVLADERIMEQWNDLGFFYDGYFTSLGISKERIYLKGLGASDGPKLIEVNDTCYRLLKPAGRSNWKIIELVPKLE